MSNKVRVKRSAVAGKVPATTDIDLGELAVNTYDGKLFIKKSVSGVESIIEIGSGGGGTSGASIAISDTAPSSPSAGDLWWDSSIGQLRIYYNDGTSSQWVDAFNSQGLQGPEGSQGPQGPQGITGAQGVAGADGNTILYGTSDPTTQGVIDDFYLNTTTYTLFGPKTISGWGTGVTLSSGGGGVVAIKETAYASGSGTFTPDPKALFTEVICTGGGGGGGGVDWTSGFAAGGGGGAGGTCISWFTPAQMGSSAAYAIGAAGTAGAASVGGSGGNGGSSTFNPAGTGNTLTAGGGAGGAGAGTTTNTQVGYIRTGGAGGTASGGDINREGQSGGHGIAFATTSMMGGNGGGSYWGNGGAGAVRSSSGATAGTSATSDGDGGGGAVNSNSTSGVAGGAGVSGKIFILEYLGA